MDLAKLAAFDALWTRHLEKHASPSNQDRVTVHGVGSTMEELLRRCEGHAHTLAELFKVHGAELEQSFQRMRSGAKGPQDDFVMFDLSERARNAVVSSVERKGGIVRAAESSAEKLARILPSERRNIVEKLSSISGGTTVEGDLSKEAVCNIAEGMVVGGFLAFETGIGAFVGAAGCVILLAAEAAGNSC
jgi:hypothetical protein